MSQTQKPWAVHTQQEIFLEEMAVSCAWGSSDLVSEKIFHWQSGQALK